MAELEAFKQLIIEKWPQILQYVLTFVAYFLVALYKSKVKGTTTTLDTLFKEKVEQVVTLDTNLRTDFSETTKKMEQDLEAAIKEYQTARAEFQQLTNTLTRTKNALMAFIMEDANDDRVETDYAEEANRNNE